MWNLFSLILIVYHQQTPADNCGKIIDIDDELKQILLDGHNKRRNTIAGGDQKGFDPAVRMPTVVSIVWLSDWNT